MSQPSLSPEQAKAHARAWATKGNEALQNENWDYAATSFLQATKLVPDNLLYRQSLWLTWTRKVGAREKAASKLHPLLVAARTKASTARTRKNWSDLIAAADEGLALNPWDPGFAADLGDAAVALDRGEIAVFAYAKSLEEDASNKTVIRSAAMLHESRGNYEVSLQLWQRLLQLDRVNSEARQHVTDVSAKQAMERSGAGTARAEEPTQTELVTAYDFHRRRPRPDESGPDVASRETILGHAIRREPNEINHYLALAEYLEKGKRFREALEIIVQALEKDTTHVVLLGRKEDLEFALLRQDLQSASESLAKTPEDLDKQERVRLLSQQVRVTELARLKKEVENSPRNLRLKLDLGRMLLEQNEAKEAVQHLQQAKTDPRLAVESNYLLGCCFLTLRQLPLAKRMLENAAKEADPSGNSALYLGVFYSLGALCRELNLLEEAENYFSKVIEVDFGYRDAYQQLEVVQQQRSSP